MNRLHTFIQTCLPKSLMVIHVCFINVCTLLDSIMFAKIGDLTSSIISSEKNFFLRHIHKFNCHHIFMTKHFSVYIWESMLIRVATKTEIYATQRVASGVVKRPLEADRGLWRPQN